MGLSARTPGRTRSGEVITANVLLLLQPVCVWEIDGEFKIDWMMKISLADRQEFAWEVRGFGFGLMLARGEMRFWHGIRGSGINYYPKGKLCRRGFPMRSIILARSPYATNERCGLTA
jgi:hypothetical protein